MRYAVTEIRANIERQGFDAIPDEIILALVDIAEAAKAVYDDSGAAGPWNDLDIALARFEWPEDQGKDHE